MMIIWIFKKLRSQEEKERKNIIEELQNLIKELNGLQK